MKQHNQRTLRSDQQGMISIMVSVILIAVISLIVLGFAQQARREARQTLDRQLSSQAFYAAESGINTARKVIDEAVSSGDLSALKKLTCDNATVPAYSKYSNQISTDPEVGYSCLTVNPVPSSLAYSLSTTGGSKITPIEGVNADGTPSQVRSLRLNWQSTGNVNFSSCPASAGSFPRVGNWNCGYGVLRVDLVPIGIDGVTNIGRDSLMRNTFTAFLVPSKGGSNTINYMAGNNLYMGRANQGASAATRCNATECSMVIRNLSPMPGNYVMRISTLYRDATVQVLGYNSASGAGLPVLFNNAQAIIDSTGQAADVLRRIQVRLPISIYGGLYSDYALQTTNSIDKTHCYYPGGAPGTCN